MDVLKDLNIVLKETGKRFADRLSLMPQLFLVFLLTNILLNLVREFLVGISVITRTSLLFGVVWALIEALAYSTMLYALSEVVLTKRLTLNLSHFKMNFARYFPDVYFVLFIFWLATWLLPIDITSPIFLIVFLLFSALPEAIYLTDASRGGVFLEALKFIETNFILWIPLALVHVLLFFTFGFLLRIPPIWLVDFRQLVLSIVFLFVLAMYYTFRGVVFDYLNGSNARKRKFMDAWK